MLSPAFSLHCFEQVLQVGLHDPGCRPSHTMDSAASSTWRVLSALGPMRRGLQGAQAVDFLARSVGLGRPGGGLVLKNQQTPKPQDAEDRKDAQPQPGIGLPFGTRLLPRRARADGVSVLMACLQRA